MICDRPRDSRSHLPLQGRRRCRPDPSRQRTCRARRSSRGGADADRRCNPRPLDDITTIGRRTRDEDVQNLRCCLGSEASSPSRRRARLPPLHHSSTARLHGARRRRTRGVRRHRIREVRRRRFFRVDWNAKPDGHGEERPIGCASGSSRWMAQASRSGASSSPCSARYPRSIGRTST